MRGFFQLYIASLREFVRDRMTIFWTLAFPLVFVVMFGVLFAFGGDSRFDVGLVVEDTGATGQQVAQILRQVPIFKITETGQDAEITALKRGDRRAVIVIPAGLTEQVA